MRRDGWGDRGLGPKDKYLEQVGKWVGPFFHIYVWNDHDRRSPTMWMDVCVCMYVGSRDHSILGKVPSTRPNYYHPVPGYLSRASFFRFPCGPSWRIGCVGMLSIVASMEGG